MLWGFTTRECEPYLKYRGREILFRECVIALLGGGKSDAGPDTKTPEQKYCMLCKTAKKNTDCKSCSFTLTPGP